MADEVARWFAGLPKEAVVFLIAMFPIVELRGAIPWALSPAMGGALPWYSALLAAVLGNMAPIPLILAFLGRVSSWLSERSRLAGIFFEWLFRRTRRKGGPIERYGHLGLVLFVAIPLPVTGGWTGAVAAFLFGFGFWRSLGCIAAGILLAGVVVTLASMGVFAALGF